VDPTTVVKTVVGLHEDRVKPTLQGSLVLPEKLLNHLREL
jgi:hypothetical protein